MGFLMALRVNTFQSCQNVVKNPPDCTTNGERFHCELLTCFCCVVFFCVFFLFLFFFFPPIFTLGVGLPRCSLHVLIYWFVFVISVVVEIWTVVGCCH